MLNRKSHVYSIVENVGILARRSRSLNLRQKSLLVLSLLCLGFVDPKENDLIELQEGLNLRSSAAFRPEDQNILRAIPKNSRGIIRKVQEFKSSGNYGLCVDFMNISNPKSECSWVYYSKSKPAVKLFDVSANNEDREKLLEQWQKRQPTQVIEIIIPRTKALIEAERKLAAILDRDWNHYAGSQFPIHKNNRNNFGTDMSKEDLTASVTQTVQTIVNVNSQSSSLTDLRISCPDGTCNIPKLAAVEKCSPENSYQNNIIDQLIHSSSQSEFFKAPQKEIITLACIQRNMTNFTKSSAYFRTCQPGQKQYGKKVTRACVNEAYLGTTAKAFNLVADCLGDYVVGYNSKTLPPFQEGVESKVLSEHRRILESAKQQASLSIFSFMAQESGMHVNAQSATGAGGPGQMTGGAIETVNNDLKDVRAHLLQNKANPYCATTLLKALEKPMSTAAAACDRKNPENILQTFAYTFSYQAFIRRHLENTAFERRVFGNVVSTDLSVIEKDRFMMELTAWAHNTGPGGMGRPLAELLRIYKQSGRKIRTPQDVDQFLKELGPIVGSFNSGRRNETSNYYNKIQEKMKSISPGGRNACLAN